LLANADAASLYDLSTLLFHLISSLLLLGRQRLLDVVLLLADFQDSGDAILSDFVATDTHFFHGAHLAFLLQALLFLLNLFAAVFILQLLEVSRIILLLQILNVLCPFPCLLNFLHSSYFLLLEHANSVAKLFDVPLDLQADRACLIVG